MYSDYGITFDGKVLWSFGKTFDRNIVILLLVIVAVMDHQTHKSG